MTRPFRSRFGGLLIFYLVFVGIAQFTRFTLLFQSTAQLDLHERKLALTCLWGLLFDVTTASYASIPMALISWMLPVRWFTRRLHRWLSVILLYVFIYILLFGTVAEWLFWEEFSSRFNFIAVDYLIYTREVIGNIQESYPLPLIFLGLAAASAFIFAIIWKTRMLQNWFATDVQWNKSRKPIVAWLVILLTLHFSLTNEKAPDFGNAYNQELARNGDYSFVAAYRENSLNYERFYPTLPSVEAFETVKQNLGVAASNPSSNDLFDITHTVTSAGPERRWNIIQITVESLSAKFLGCFGNPNHLSPHLDKIFTESLVFTNFYATGTRTVRGMEALTLCVPPTPGQSIVRRPHNENLFSVGELFRTRGYDTAFIYSGYGYFDNMNAFFAGNGYRIIDRASVAKSDITYATIWGACDEDLFRWTAREADAAWNANKPFHYFVMTTSNHRPYGFPPGCVDLPTGHREGAVQYTDYAIGKFLEAARDKPWFTNTLFVIVADHCASAAGRTALSIPGYHIPVFVWNPTLIQPAQVGVLCSQIDLWPTLLGLMNWTYDSRFYGKDILRMKPEEQRAYISTYQLLGYFVPDRLAILAPTRKERVFALSGFENPIPAPPDADFLREAISPYQTASYLFAHGLNHISNAK